MYFVKKQEAEIGTTGGPLTRDTPSLRRPSFHYRSHSESSNWATEGVKNRSDVYATIYVIYLAI